MFRFPARILEHPAVPLSVLALLVVSGALARGQWNAASATGQAVPEQESAVKTGTAGKQPSSGSSAEDASSTAASNELPGEASASAPASQRAADGARLRWPVSVQSLATTDHAPAGPPRKQPVRLPQRSLFADDEPGAVRFAGGGGTAAAEANAGESIIQYIANWDPTVQAAEPLSQRVSANEEPLGFLPWGPWREVRADLTYIDSVELLFADLEFWTIFAIPTISDQSPLVFTPGYGAHFVDSSPPAPDVPGHVHDVYLDALWRHRWVSIPELTTDIAVTPGLYSDFEGNLDSDALRIGARVVGDFLLDNGIVLRVGLAYLDREDVNFLPVGGVIWKPDDDTTVELVLPKPRYVRRFYRDRCLERFWYVGGEFGGGSWAVERANGTNDILNYSDWRLVFGYKQKTRGGLMALVEIGLVFNRQMEYRNGQEFDPETAFMARVGLGY